MLHVDVNFRPDFDEQHYKGEGNWHLGERVWSKGVEIGTRGVGTRGWRLGQGGLGHALN